VEWELVSEIPAEPSGKHLFSRCTIGPDYARFTDGEQPGRRAA
jgi:hypothetical protein